MDALRHQLEAYLSHAARNPAASFEQWMDSKDFAAADRTHLRRLFRRMR